MLSVDEALRAVLEHSGAKQPTLTGIDETLGLVLAEDVPADVDSPPHEKSLVDGYAVRAADLRDGGAKLSVLEQVTAGEIPTRAVASGQSTRLMTGAPLPEGADSVVMHERTEFGPDHDVGAGLGIVRIQDDRFHPGQNVMHRGESFRAGQVVLQRGVELGPAEIGLLAEVGRAKVSAIGPASVAILCTGNELVPPAEKPGPGQIRNSNGPMLTAAVRRAGATAIDLGVARDERDDLRQLIRAGLQSDVLLLSGGVSAGVLDLVPEVLAELGVRQVFHKVQLKPGKPLWFGVADPSLATDHRPLTTLVFGLPGNPVSTLVCFALFVKPALARIAGRPWNPPHATRPARLTREFTHRGDRPTYHPARLVESPEGLSAEPTHWAGSADLRGLAGANALIAFSAGDRSYQPGTSVDVLPL